MRKALLFLCFVVLFSGSAFAQEALSDSGFTNKAEAKNLMVNGLKEGKWVEYFDADEEGQGINTHYYILTVYKAGNKYGIEKCYDSNGILLRKYLYENGEKNGVAKGYYESGKLYWEATFKDGKINGLHKTYYSNGKLKCVKVYSNSSLISTKNFDENGNEIK